MNGKLSKKIRKLQQMYDYTNPMYKEMKRIVYKMTPDKKHEFSKEIHAIIIKHAIS